MAVNRAPRCAHACYAGMCPMRTCPHWDGLRADHETKDRNRRGRKRSPTKACLRCHRQVARELLDARGYCACETGLKLTDEEKSRLGGARG